MVSKEEEDYQQTLQEPALNSNSREAKEGQPSTR
jgi:hypothetical protein